MQSDRFPERIRRWFKSRLALPMATLPGAENQLPLHKRCLLTSLHSSLHPLVLLPPLLLFVTGPGLKVCEFSRLVQVSLKCLQNWSLVSL